MGEMVILQGPIFWDTLQKRCVSNSRRLPVPIFLVVGCYSVSVGAKAERHK